MNFLIRKMIMNDLEQVVAIDQVSFSLPWPARSFQFELTDNPASRCWVVELDGKIIAMIVSWLILDELHIATIATHPDFRRQGIGKKLITHALKSARDEGVTRAFLEVRESNKMAINMYKSFGFVEDGRRKEYYKDNHEDAILMTLNDLSHL
jgi:[ribosomal protein S18]-alanine N-acetyltransferase